MPMNTDTRRENRVNRSSRFGRTRQTNPENQPTKSIPLKKTDLYLAVMGVYDLLFDENGNTKTIL